MSILDRDPIDDPAALTASLLDGETDSSDSTGTEAELFDDVLFDKDGDQTLRDALRTGGVSMAAVLFGLNLVDEFDRVALLVLGPDIQKTFGLSDGMLGLINGIGGVLIFLGAIPFGLMADRSKRTRVVVASSAIWALFAFLGGLARNSFMLASTRVINGIGKGNGPVHNSLLADTYPIESRGRIFAMHNLANPLGNMLGPALAGGVAALAGGTQGWRWSLMVLAVPAFVLTLAATRLREPERGRFERDALTRSSGEDAPDTPDDTQQMISVGAGFERLKQIKTFFYLMSGLGALGFAVAGAPTVFNLFLEETHDLDALGRGFVGSCIAVGGAVGTLVGGRFSDQIVRERPRRLVELIGCSIALFGVLYPMALFFPLPAMVAMIAVATSLVSAPLVSMTALISAIVPFRLRGLGYGMVGLYLFLVGGLIGGVLVGTLSDIHGERTALLMSVPTSCIVAGIVIVYAGRFVRRDISLVVEEMQEERRERVRAAGASADVPAIQVRNLDFSYGQVQVLFDVDVDVNEGEVLALLGTNGAGKSTLLKAISGLSLPSRGAVRFRGSNITYAAAEDRVRLGIVQVPGGKAVFPTLTVAENLLAGAYTFVWDVERVDARVDEILELFPKLRERLAQPAGTMSGGEQQMLAIAKALLLEPQVLIIDELSLGLAPVVVQELLQVVESLKARGITMILVEQSVNVALSVADRAVFMEKGQVRFEGPARDLLERDDLVRAVFLGSEGG